MKTFEGQFAQQNKNNQLAILNGEPVRKQPWPKWPRADENTERNILEVLHSGRWAISGFYTGKDSFERRFARAFADFHEVPFCVPTTNGSSALTIALEALNVSNGTEVLVPGLTWVACASSVAGIGAIPVLVDIEPHTLCMSVEAAKQAINDTTSAIILVHLFCTVANIDGFIRLSQETGIPLIEDCSQAHGAVWKGQRVGTFGDIGIFSMQQIKVLTSGEGGAAITSNPKLFDRMQQLRADGRRYYESTVHPGEMELEEVGSVQGRNYCLSEFHSAILLDRLKSLDVENELRERNAAYLISKLQDIGGITPLYRYPEVDKQTFYHFCVSLNPEDFGHINLETICKALTAELNILVESVDTPLNKNILYNPLLSPRTPTSEDIRRKFDPKRFVLPVAAKAKQECLTIPHWVLLGSQEDVEDIVEAFIKVKSQLHLLANLK